MENFSLCQCYETKKVKTAVAIDANENVLAEDMKEEEEEGAVMKRGENPASLSC